MIVNVNYLLHKSYNKNFYLINSQEQIAIDFITDFIRSKIKIAEVNKFYIDKNFNFESVRELIINPSIFATDTFIILHFKTKPNAKEQAIISEILDYKNIFLIVTCSLTKKDLLAPWIDKFNSLGLVINFNKSDVRDIINYQLKKSNLTISNTAYEMLVNLHQDNVMELMQEINILALSYNNTEITPNQIQSNNNSKYDIYQLSKAYLVANISQTIIIFDNIYQSSTDAILINWMISEDIRKLLLIKAKLKQQSYTVITQELKIWRDKVDDYRLAHLRIGYKKLLTIFDMLATFDLILKGVIQDNVKTYLKQIFIELCT